MPRKKDSFSELSIPEASLTADAEDCYIVYKSPTEFSKIKADTAFSAIELSGIKNPYRIIHRVNMANIVLQEGELVKKVAKNTEKNSTSN
jgi:hypothetical protein